MKLLDYKEASEYVRLSENTMRRYVYRRKVPHIKLGSRVFFDPAELDEWLNSKRVPAATGGNHESVAF